jgi:mono/diheme cytochrome c family protein
MFRRFVNALEVLALIGVAVTVVLLFANEPDSASTAPTTPGAEIYAASCASCHGADGGGGLGPQLAGGAAKNRFPTVDDQIRFVTNGSGVMPSFGGKLSPAQIRDVVAYTRTL